MFTYGATFLQGYLWTFPPVYHNMLYVLLETPGETWLFFLFFENLWEDTGWTMWATVIWMSWHMLSNKSGQTEYGTNLFMHIALPHVLTFSLFYAHSHTSCAVASCSDKDNGKHVKISYIGSYSWSPMQMCQRVAWSASQCSLLLIN